MKSDVVLASIRYFEQVRKSLHPECKPSHNDSIILPKVAFKGLQLIYL